MVSVVCLYRDSDRLSRFWLMIVRLVNGLWTVNVHSIRIWFGWKNQSPSWEEKYIRYINEVTSQSHCTGSLSSLQGCFLRLCSLTTLLTRTKSTIKSCVCHKADESSTRTSRRVKESSHCSISDVLFHFQEVRHVHDTATSGEGMLQQRKEPSTSWPRFGETVHQSTTKYPRRSQSYACNSPVNSVGCEKLT